MPRNHPLIWRLLNLSKILDQQPATTLERINQEYARRNHPPVQHVSINGEATNLGTGAPELKVIAENLEPLPFSTWKIRAPQIKCGEPHEENHHYSAHPHELPSHPIAASETKGTIKVIMRSTRGMGAGGAHIEFLTLNPRPHQNRGSTLGNSLTPTPLNSIAEKDYSTGSVRAHLYSDGTITVSLTQGPVSGLTLIQPPGNARVELENRTLTRVYNPTVYITQPYALVKKTLYPGDRVASNLLIVGIRGSWTALTSPGPVTLTNEDSNIIARTSSPLLTLSSTSQVPYTIIPFWANFHLPLHHTLPCSTPILSGGDPRIVVSGAEWVREGREWIVRLQLSNPTGTALSARLSVRPPHYVHSFQLEGEDMTPDDKNTLRLFLGAYGVVDAELTLKESRLAYLLGGKKGERQALRS